MKYGYLRKDNRSGVNMKTIQSLCDIGCEQIVVEELGSHVNENRELTILLETMEAGDSVVVQELSQLGKTLTSLSDLLNVFKEKNVELEVLNEDFDIERFLPIVKVLDNMERTVRRELTLKGLEKAKEHGRKGGRPNISGDVIVKIQKMFSERRYPLREIADRCDVSLGTVYKYAHQAKAQ